MGGISRRALDSRPIRPWAQGIATLAGAGVIEPRAHSELSCGDLEPEHYAPGAEIGAGEPPHMKWLLDGWACEARLLGDGRRQIFSFAIPGDVVELPLTRSRTVVALTAVRCVDVGRLAARAAEADEVLDSMFRAAAAASERRYDHIARLWGRSALGRLASLLVELHDRLDQVGMVRGEAFALPLRHEELADALGLSTVHVTRCFRTLRERGAATMKFRRVCGFNRRALEALRD